MSSPLKNAVARRAKRWLESQPDEVAELSGTTATRVRSAVVEAMAQNECDHYTRRPGIASLCQLVSQRMAAKDVDIDPNDGVVITGGAAETRYVALRALAAHSTVYVRADDVARYQVVADLAEVTLAPVDIDNPISKDQEGILLVRQSTGAVTEEYAELVKWAGQNDMTIIADEIERPLLSDDELRPIASLPGMAGRTLTLGGFTHEPGLQAWQVAWFAGPKPLATRVRTLKQAMTICSPAPGQYAALAATQEVST